MKTLENHTLLYDNDCPLCNVYTSGFIKANMLDTNGRKPFGQLSPKEQHFIDLKRATNEIALVDNKNKTVIYGIDSLLKVIGNSFPLIEKIGKLAFIHFLLKKLYSFISYNRKVIIPSKNKSELQCVPDFNYTYRIAYIVFAAVLTALVLYKFSNTVAMLPALTLGSAFIFTCSQIMFQRVFLIGISPKSFMNYSGNLMTVLVFGSLIFALLLLLNSVVTISSYTLTVGFGVTILSMFYEHWRRVKLLQLPLYLSYTWILYSILSLLIILNI